MATFFKTQYNKFLANPRNATLADNISLLYVTSTTKFEGRDAVVNHVSRQAAFVKKKSEQIISAIESSSALFLEGGGAYLPSFDDNFLADRTVTLPLLHIVQWNAQNEIQQIRIYWDQASLLKEVEVIGSRGKNWPIRAGSEQIRLLKSATTEASAPAQSTAQDPPPRSSSPTKRHIKDPYAADSLFDLISPTKGRSQQKEAVSPSKRYSKDPYAANSLFDLVAPGNSDEPEPETHTARPASPGKRITKDPYAANSLADLLSPADEDAEGEHGPRPFARASAHPPPRDLSEIFVDEEAPTTPSKPERVIAPKAGAGKFQGNRIFGEEEEPSLDERVPYKSNPRRFDHFNLGDEGEDDIPNDRAPYKSNPHRFDHFNLADEPETKEAPKQNKVRQQPHWNFDEPNSPLVMTKMERSPPARPAVIKPRRDAEVHFDMVDDKGDGDDGRIISSYQNRGQRLYENRLFDEHGEAEPSEVEKKNNRPLSVVGHNANRQKDFDQHWDTVDEAPEPFKADAENKPLAFDRAKSVQMMEAHWDLPDDSPQPERTATARPNRRHNQPSWSLGNEE
ncbi:hypothetical protein N7470_001675 [Penicillium chermesinum]|nr:hypothetical protein N7470_001675 [Penicillium chermesinum]